MITECSDVLEIMQILSHTFFYKNFVKATVLLKKELIRRNFSGVRENFTFFHTVTVRSQCHSVEITRTRNLAAFGLSCLPPVRPRDILSDIKTIFRHKAIFVGHKDIFVGHKDILVGHKDICRT